MIASIYAHQAGQELYVPTPQSWGQLVTVHYKLRSQLPLEYQAFDSSLHQVIESHFHDLMENVVTLKNNE